MKTSRTRIAGTEERKRLGMDAIVPLRLLAEENCRSQRHTLRTTSSETVTPPAKERNQPVLRSPAEMPLIVAAMARFTSGVSSPARLRRSMSTWIKCMGST